MTGDLRLSPLRALFEATRAVRSEGDLSAALATIARVISEALGFRTVAVNLYRPAWNDFHVTTVHGNEQARATLLGDARDWSTWEPLLDERFLRHGVYFIPNGEFDWDGMPGATYTPELDACDDPDAWHPEDALMVPMLAPAGELLGILSVDEPVSGRRPSDSGLDLLASLADHAALAVHSAQEALEAASYRRALEQLLDVSSKLTQSLSAASILQAVCSGIGTALGFEKVAVAILERETGLLHARAAVGWNLTEEVFAEPVVLEDISRLLDPAFEIAGCYLLPNDEARSRLNADYATYSSQLNGRGPRAWNHHWLIVPLYDAGGSVIGVIWADEPHDRLLPQEERLKSLRVFANQATTALASASQFEQLEYLADHDPLTNLLNRRAFVRELEHEAARALRYGRSVALVIFDLDGFKAVNDRFGHVAGDAALQSVARLLGSILRGTDRAFRIGGDEFALLLVEAAEGDAREIVRRVDSALASNPDSRIRSLKASFGVAVGAERGAEGLFSLADEAMYTAKRAERRIHVAA